VGGPSSTGLVEDGEATLGAEVADGADLGEVAADVEVVGPDQRHVRALGVLAWAVKPASVAPVRASKAISFRWGVPRGQDTGTCRRQGSFLSGTPWSQWPTP